MTRADLSAGFLVFCMVFFTALPAVVPFIVIQKAQIALGGLGLRRRGFGAASP